MTLVKICGIRTVEEGLAALDAGADWLGFVLWPGSRRAIDAVQAASVAAALRQARPGWAAVGVFVNPSADEVRRAVETCGLDWVQLSGEEAEGFTCQVPARVLKAVRVRPGEEAAVAQHVGQRLARAGAGAAHSLHPLTREREAPGAVRQDAQGATYLLDTHRDGWYGGTGRTFNWGALAAIGPVCFVAGGLHPDNVAVALAALSPRGVDVSSGVERPGGGKDPRLMRAFVEAVRTHDLAHAH